MLVRDLMTLSVTTVSPGSSISRVIDVMRREDTGIVPVCDGQNHLLGLITDRDIVLRSGLFDQNTSWENTACKYTGWESTACKNTARGKATCETTAEGVMTTEIVSVSPGDDIHKAALVLSENRIRRLPVIENDRLVGILSLRDLAKKKVMTAEIGHIIYQVCSGSRQ